MRKEFGIDRQKYKVWFNSFDVWLRALLMKRKNFGTYIQDKAMLGIVGGFCAMF
jgi:hypothetical protein